jgi:predicted nucleic acid-binding protein
LIAAALSAKDVGKRTLQALHDLLQPAQGDALLGACAAVERESRSRQAEMVEPAIHRRENDASPSLLRRRFVEKCLRLATVRPTLNDVVRLRATELNAQGFSPLDALHLATAEEAAADYFLSCDDRIVRRYSGKLRVQNPQTFINTLGPTT